MRRVTLIARLVLACSLAIPATLCAATPDDTISAREYAVYSQALAFLADSLHMTPPLLVEGQTHPIERMVHWMGEDSMFYAQSGLVLDSGMMSRFLAFAGKTTILRARFADSLNVVLISEMEMHLLFAQGKRLETMYEVFPHARSQGLLGLNRIAINEDGTLALVYASALFGFHNDWGQYMLLQKTGDRWNVAGTKLILER